MLLIGWSKLTTNQKNYPDLSSDASSVWNFRARFSDVISRRCKMSAVFLRLRTTTLLPIIAAQELVSTTLLTSPFVFAQASSTFRVPSTAGPITSISSFGSSIGKGDATWITKVQSLTALLIKWPIKPHFTITDGQNCSSVHQPKALELLLSHCP